MPGAWLMLTTLSATQSDAGTAAQLADVPPPPPPPGPPPGYVVGASPTFAGAVVLPLVVWVGLVAIVVSTAHNHDFIARNSPRPNSPA